MDDLKLLRKGSMMQIYFILRHVRQTLHDEVSHGLIMVHSLFYGCYLA